MQRKYVFVVRDNLVRSIKGNRELIVLNNGAVKEFFKAETASELFTLLQQLLLQKEKFVAAVLNESSCEGLSDECYTPVSRDTPAEMPSQKDANAALHSLFPTEETQRLILASNGVLLKETLQWWHRRICVVWRRVFNAEPDIFCSELATSEQN